MSISKEHPTLERSIPALGKSYAPLGQFLARANALMLVEARNRGAATQHFSGVLDSKPATAVVKLSARLYFTQAQRSGRYWIFRRRG
jgi:hypothetical protein